MRRLVVLVGTLAAAIALLLSVQEELRRPSSNNATTTSLTVPLLPIVPSFSDVVMAWGPEPAPSYVQLRTIPSVHGVGATAATATSRHARGSFGVYSTIRPASVKGMGVTVELWARAVRRIDTVAVAIREDGGHREAALCAHRLVRLGARWRRFIVHGHVRANGRTSLTVLVWGRSVSGASFAVDDAIVSNA